MFIIALYKLWCPYLYYGVTSWGSAAAKYTHRVQIEQNYIVKVITKLPFVKTKIAPLYDQLSLLRLIDIYKLKVLKFMLSLKKKFFQNVLTITILFPRKYTSILPNLLVMITGQ